MYCKESWWRLANEKNLKPQAHKLTVEEQSRGGKKSVEARRKKKLLKECMEKLLQLPVSDKKIYKKLENMGIPSEDIDNQYRITVALFLKAASGDVAAYREIRDVMGEKDDELDKVDEILNEVDNIAVE